MDMIWTAILAGGAAGLIHVLSGPDHLAAVAPLSLNKDRQPWRTGLQWALGHCAGVMLIGLLALLFRELLPLDAISSWSERFVGVLLIALGAWGICKSFTHANAELPRAAFAIGAVHGLAGSSHLLGVVPGVMFPPLAASAYFIAFAAGSILAMMAFSSAFAAVPQRFYRFAMNACCGAAVAIGCYWLVA